MSSLRARARADALSDRNARAKFSLTQCTPAAGVATMRCFSNYPRLARIDAIEGAREALSTVATGGWRARRRSRRRRKIATMRAL